MVDPRMLCRDHLLGEHKELHMLVGCIRAGTSLAGYLRDGLVEVHRALGRHDTLVTEMCRRGYRHKSPIVGADAELLRGLGQRGLVDARANEQELIRRCPVGCRPRVELLHELRAAREDETLHEGERAALLDDVLSRWRRLDLGREAA